MREYLRFLVRCFRLSFVGDWRYYTWMLVLTCIALLGLNAYCKQLVSGLATTGMTDQVSWGLYIANFTYLVGMAAAVMLVIPAYVYRNEDLHEVVIFGELLAVAVIIMCLLFVTVDLGSPERFIHLFLRFNFPLSMLTWDVIVLNGYLLINLHITGYLIYSAYRKREPNKRLFLVPFVLVAIVWAISIHTVTAFLYSGLGGRPFWNHAIIAPRFIASAFAAGPAFIVLTLQVIGRFTTHHVPVNALRLLRQVIIVAMTINVFLLISEMFTEFYTGADHLLSTHYLYFGLGEHRALVPWIWSAVGINTTALVLLYLPQRNRGLWLLNTACVMLIVGIWIEKGMGLIVPAFIPTPLGEVVEYLPTLNEVLVGLGIWAFGLLLYTIMVRITVPVLKGDLTVDTLHPTEVARMATA